jgi:hypothetical protein
VGDLTAFGTVGEWQGSGRVLAGSWKGRGRGTVWEQHGMCELAFNAAGERHGDGICVNRPPAETVISQSIRRLG